MQVRNYIIPLVAISLMTACNPSRKESTMLKQSDFPAPPIAEVIPETFVNFGQRRVDNYFWLKKSNPKVIEYLNAEMGIPTR